MKNILIIMMLILTSCSTYNESIKLDEFKSNNDTYQVWKTNKFDRKSKTLIETNIDTVKLEAPRRERFVGTEYL